MINLQLVLEVPHVKELINEAAIILTPSVPESWRSAVCLV